MANIFKPPCDEGVIRGAPADAPCSQQAAPWILAATILGSSMVFIDGTVVNVALPALQADLGATVGDAQWVVEAYGLFLAALLLVGGAVGDRLGRRRIFLTGLILFALASVACGLSQSVGQLIAARSIQGIGGALLTPESLAIISASFDEDRRGKAIGTWSAFTSVASGAGPIVGGYLIAAISWRFAFFINAPLAAVVLGITLRGVPESRSRSISSALDVRGAALATLGLGGLVYGLVTASVSGFGDPGALAAMVGGAAVLCLFVLMEGRTESPMMPLSVFKSRTFSGANAFTFLLYAPLSGALFFFPFDLIQVQGYSATAAGAAFLPFVLLMFLLSRWSGGLVERYGPKPPLIVGAILAAIGFALFVLPSIGGSYWTTFFAPVAVLGLGMAIAVAPLTTTVMGGVAGSDAGVASGINNAVSRVAGLVATAVLSAVMVSAFSASIDRRMVERHVDPGIVRALDDQRVKLAAMDVPAAVAAPSRDALRQDIAQAFVDGFRVVTLIGSALALLSAVCAAATITDAIQAPSSA